MSGEFTEKWNKNAHENCIRKLNEANSRIVEFERIKKGHLEYVKQLRDNINELKTIVKQILDYNDHCADFSNGITNEYGTIDEGNVRYGEFIQEINERMEKIK